EDEEARPAREHVLADLLADDLVLAVRGARELFADASRDRGPPEARLVALDHRVAVEQLEREAEARDLDARLLERNPEPEPRQALLDVAAVELLEEGRGEDDDADGGDQAAEHGDLFEEVPHRKPTCGARNSAKLRVSASARADGRLKTGGFSAGPSRR